MITEVAIRQAIAAKIVAVVGETDAKVYDFWCLGEDANDWPGQLRLDDSNKVHGYVVRFGGIEQEDETPAGGLVGWTFHVTGLMSYEHGQSDSDFGGNVVAIARALAPGDLVLPEDQEVHHEGLQIFCDLYRIGTELFHIAQGTVTARFTDC